MRLLNSFFFNAVSSGAASAAARAAMKNAPAASLPVVVFEREPMETLLLLHLQEEAAPDDDRNGPVVRQQLERFCVARTPVAHFADKFAFHEAFEGAVRRGQHDLINDHIADDHKDDKEKCAPPARGGVDRVHRCQDGTRACDN